MCASPSPSALLRTQSDERLVKLAREGSRRGVRDDRRAPPPRAAGCVPAILPEARAEDVAAADLHGGLAGAARAATTSATLRAWLCRIARNKSLNALRVRGLRLRGAARGRCGRGPAPDEEVERREDMRETLAGLAALPDRQRAALLRSPSRAVAPRRRRARAGLTDGALAPAPAARADDAARRGVGAHAVAAGGLGGRAAAVGAAGACAAKVGDGRRAGRRRGRRDAGDRAARAPATTSRAPGSRRRSSPRRRRPRRRAPRRTAAARRRRRGRRRRTARDRAPRAGRASERRARGRRPTPDNLRPGRRSTTARSLRARPPVTTRDNSRTWLRRRLGSGSGSGDGTSGQRVRAAVATARDDRPPGACLRDTRRIAPRRPSRRSRCWRPCSRPPRWPARDRNHDRIPDRWERHHHLSLKVKQTRRDQDRDGLNNLASGASRSDPRTPTPTTTDSRTATRTPAPSTPSTPPPAGSSSSSPATGRSSRAR